MPIGALAEVVNGRLHLEAVVARPGWNRSCCGNRARATIRCSWARAVGEALLSRGGDAILREVYGHSSGGTGATRRACVVAGDSPAMLRLFSASHEIRQEIRNAGRRLRECAFWWAAPATRPARFPLDCAIWGRMFWRFPLIEIRKPRSYKALDSALKNLR